MYVGKLNMCSKKKNQTLGFSMLDSAADSYQSLTIKTCKLNVKTAELLAGCVCLRDYNFTSGQ